MITLPCDNDLPYNNVYSVLHEPCQLQEMCPGTSSGMENLTFCIIKQLFELNAM